MSMALLIFGGSVGLGGSHPIWGGGSLSEGGVPKWGDASPSQKTQAKDEGFIAQPRVLGATEPPQNIMGTGEPALKF